MPLNPDEYPYSFELGDTLMWLPEALRWAENDLEMAKILLSIIAAESRGDPEAVGDKGRSHGLIQMYEVHGISVADRQNPDKALQWRMTHPEGVEQWNISQHLQNYLSQGYVYGSQLASELGGKVQVSDPAYHGRYGAKWEAIDSALGGAQTSEAALAAVKGQKYNATGARGANSGHIGLGEDDEAFPLEGVVAISPGTKPGTPAAGGKVLPKVVATPGVTDYRRTGKYIRGIPLPPRHGPTGAGYGYD